MCVFFPFCPPSFSLSGRKASSRNTSSPMYYCCSQRGIWPGFKGDAKLVSARSFLASRLLCSGLCLQPRGAARSTWREDGDEEEHPVPGSFLPSPQLREPSAHGVAVGSARRVQHPGREEGDAVRSWLRRRTRQQHVECSRSLFCLARWPALFSHSTPSPSLLSLPLL